MNLLKDTNNLIRHLTVTGYVLNSKKNKMLLVEHKKLDRWLPPGGHLEDNEVPHEGAIREVFEETKVVAKPLLSDEPDLKLKGIIDIQIPKPLALTYQLIPGHHKADDHVHLDMIYLLEAGSETKPKGRKREVKGVGWFTKTDIISKIKTFDSVISIANLYMSD